MKEKQFSCAIFIQELETLNRLTDLLSRFKSIKICAILNNTFEAIETLSQDRISILFMNTNAMEKMQFVHRPHFIVGICNKKESKHLKKWLDSGFIDFIFDPIQEDDFNTVMSKILTLCHFYSYNSKQDNMIAEENFNLYNKNFDSANKQRESVIVQGNNKAEKIRIFIDELLFIKYIDDKTHLFYNDGTEQILKKRLKYFSNTLPEEKFQRISKSVLVNVGKINNISKKWIIQVGNEYFTVSRTFRKILKSKISSL